MRYAATRFESDGMYAETFTANSWAEAETICEENGWRLDGDNAQVIKARSDEEAMIICNALNERDGTVVQ